VRRRRECRGAPALEDARVGCGGRCGEQQQRGGEQALPPRVEGVRAQQRAERRHRTHHAVEPLLLQLRLRRGGREVVGGVPHAQLLHGAVRGALVVEALEDVRQQVVRDLAVRLALDRDQVLLRDVPGEAAHAGAALRGARTTPRAQHAKGASRQGGGRSGDAPHAARLGAGYTPLWILWIY